MKNILALLKRDFLRLVKTPAALVVVLALLVLPSVYAWYNVAAFWDPYGNTGSLKVNVVNEDTGASNELVGELNLGNMIVETLEQNDQLDWQFCDYDSAMDELQSGECYAIFVIPSDFSADLLTIVTGDFTQPNLQYYVNEKLSPVAPKITDSGSTTLDETINSTFIATVTDVVVNAADELIGDASTQLANTKTSIVSKLDNAISKVDDASTTMGTLSAAAGAGSTKVLELKDELAALDTNISDLKDKLELLSSQTNSTNTDVLDSTDELSALQSVDILKLFGEGSSASEAANAVANSVDLGSQTVKSILTALSGLTQKASSLESVIDTQSVLNAQAQTLLVQLADLMSSTQNATSQTSDLISDVQDELQSLRDDIDALSVSATLEALNTKLGNSNGNGLDAEAISEFMASPTTIVTEQLYELTSYGSAMAPLFMNLTFWIGAFMLLVIMKQEVDSEGIKNLTLAQKFIGRYLFFAGPAVLQAIICCIGIMALGVGVQNVGALFLAAAISSLTYLAIIYTLSVVLQHIGKGICLVLVFTQIPGATGLYPIETTAPFFQAIYPLLPFTYGIGAMREAICGFYGTQYIQDLCILGVFLVVFFALGLIFRPLMVNVNHMVSDQIKESGIFNGEKADVPMRPYRIGQIVRALTKREEYRQAILRRSERFERWYPKIIRASIVVGIIVPALLAILFAVTPAERIVLLVIALVWMVAFFIFLTVVESLRASLARQLALDEIPDDQLIYAYASKGGSDE
jgi:putative membrane protein